MANIVQRINEVSDGNGFQSTESVSRIYISVGGGC